MLKPILSLYLPFINETSINSFSKTTVLKKLIDKSEKQPLLYLDSTYKNIFTPELTLAERDFPFAAMHAAFHNLPAHEGVWAQLCPVELKADLAGIYLLGGEHLQVREQEYQEIYSLLQTYYEDEFCHFYLPSTHLLLIQFKEKIDIKSTEYSTIIAKEISPFMPKGEKAQYIQKMMTEWQMLLHQQEFNIKRAQANQSMINTLWPQYFGCSAFLMSEKYDVIIADDPIGIVIAKTLNIPFFSLEQFIDAESYHSPLFIMTGIRQAILQGIQPEPAEISLLEEIVMKNMPQYSAVKIYDDENIYHYKNTFGARLQQKVRQFSRWIF